MKNIITNKRGETHINTAVKIIISVVIGALLLGGLFVVFASEDGILNTASNEVAGLMDYTQELRDERYYDEENERYTIMSKLDLTKYGITGTTEVVHNPSYEELFAAETDPTLEGFEKGQLTELGAVNVMTGIYTGRSPKDKFIVMDETSKDTIWWTSDEFKNDNKPASVEAWNECIIYLLLIF